jgi:NAD(P)-dependent dehydrogenase (short-subunit alcohol dehydrogenase family)
VVRLETLTAPLGDRAMTAALDVTRLPRRLQAVEAVLATLGRLHVVANVAGYLRVQQRGRSITEVARGVEESRIKLVDA